MAVNSSEENLLSFPMDIDGTVPNQGIFIRSRKRTKSFSTGATNVTFQEHTIGRQERAAILGRHKGFRGCTIWFTGLSGAGKTTISFGLEKALTEIGIPCYGLDGDNLRHGICRNLTFTKEDRSENIRRVAETAKIMSDAGMICLAACISPFKTDRDVARKIHEKEDLRFFEVHVSTSLDVCESRDPKSEFDEQNIQSFDMTIQDLYKKARAGEIAGFTGIDSAYEIPEEAELVIDAGSMSPEQCVEQLLQYLYDEGIIPIEALPAQQNIPEPPKRELAPLRPLFVENEDIRTQILAQTGNLPSVELSKVDLQWLQVLAEGWATPLSGFMRERQYLQALHFGQLIDLKHKTVFPGEKDDRRHDSWNLKEPMNQSIPILLPITEETKKSLYDNEGKLVERIALKYNGRVMAVIDDGEIFDHRKEERIARTWGYTGSGHPAVDLIRESGDFCLGGDVKVLERIVFNDGLDKFRRTPTELRQIFQDLEADAVFAFQLRNPIHNGHALLMQDTRASLLKKYKNPVLLLHPLGGWTKDDDVPLDVRIKQHEAVMASGVLDPSWTVLSIFPSPMLYAGPTEVQWHARARIASGVDTYIVGRDPAGIQKPGTDNLLYEPTHGAKVLSMAPGLSQLNIVPFRVAAYDKKAGKMGFFDSKRKEDFDFISGTRMRTLARTGEQPPHGFMVDDAWEVLAGYYRSLQSK